MIFDAGGRALRRAAGFVTALVPMDPGAGGTVLYGATAPAEDSGAEAEPDNATDEEPG